MVVTILVTLAVLALLILVHELGHFAAARWFDIRVPRFSIGLGPKVIGFRRGETEYRISALPLGGYVKIDGLKEMEALEGGEEDPPETDPERTFESKSPLARAVVLSAGVTMNAVVAVLLFALVAVVWGTPVPPEPVVGNVVEEWLPDGAAGLAAVEPGSRVTHVAGRPVEDMDQVARTIMAAHAGPLTLRFDDRDPVTIRIPDDAGDRRLLPLALEPASTAEAVVGKVADGSAADRAGLRTGDRVAAVNGSAIETWQQLQQIVDASPGRTLLLDVEREGGAVERLSVTPSEKSVGSRTVGRLGAARAPEASAETDRERKGPVAAIAHGANQSWDMVSLMGQFAVGLFDGRHSPRELGGPILIGQLSGAAARAGLPTLLTFVALLSINLAVINLLPIPALDGGHLMFLAVEVVRGRPAPKPVQLALGKAGVALVFGIMVWAVAVDLLRVLGR